MLGIDATGTSAKSRFGNVLLASNLCRNWAGERLRSAGNVRLDDTVVEVAVVVIVRDTCFARVRTVGW